ncbi:MULTISPECIES: PIN domain-containing protein [unclassified Nostoc]|uniref:PIN domain-containing protein n=1 Tax=unclassified Nostoc TaxID=2593658 RepID=UPI0025F52E70|nr:MULTISPECIES: PIN domain-containing protein [unclassified Nostoc]
MRILIDTNVVLDFLQAREPFVEDAAKVFAKIDAGEIEGFIAATTITNSITLSAKQGVRLLLKMQLHKF